MRRIALATVLTAAAVMPLHEAQAKYCPRVLYRATRLVVVSVPNMQATQASVRTFERKSPESPWEPRSDAAAAAVVAVNGIAWGDIYQSLAKTGEPVKREGDQRTPAGIFRISATFGTDASKLPGYLPLVPAKQFCAEDASSRPKAQFGSCIFLHALGHPDSATDARIALPEDWVAYLQEWSAHRFAAIAIVSEDTIDRYNGCLLDTVSASNAASSVPLPVRKSAALPSSER